MRVLLLGMLAMLVACALSPLAAATPAPMIETIPGGAGQPMEVHVFAPASTTPSPRAAIVLFHGGGWTMGDATWIQRLAALLAAEGMVAVSVGYRLSDQAEITPFDAVADARAAIRWVRRNAAQLEIDPDRVAAGGVSAGGHLAAAAATFDEPSGDEVSARPDLLVLSSPAVAVADSGWFRRLSGGVAQAAALSPDRHVRHGMPPAIVLQGAEDSVTPAAGAEAFCAQMRRAHSTCELHVYAGVGHLFTRNLAQQEAPDYTAIDLAVRAQADAAIIAFLRDLEFIRR